MLLWHPGARFLVNTPAFSLRELASVALLGHMVCMASVQHACSVTLCNPMNGSRSGSTVRGIIPARVVEWAAISASRGSYQPRDHTRVSWGSWLVRWILYHWATWEVQLNLLSKIFPKWQCQFTLSSEVCEYPDCSQFSSSSFTFSFHFPSSHRSIRVSHHAFNWHFPDGEWNWVLSINLLTILFCKVHVSLLPMLFWAVLPFLVN